MMEGVPDVTASVIRGAGSVQNAIKALRSDESDEAQRFISTYDAMSASDRKRIRLEEIFTAVEISPRRFIEVLTGALMQQCQDVTKMMVAVAQPKVIQATIKAATDEIPIVADIGNRRVVVGHTNGDTKAMELFHKATGFLPTPKGSNTTINLNQLNQTANLGDGEPSGEPAELQSMDEFLMDMQDVLRPAMLPAPSPDPVLAHTPEIEYLDADV